MSYILDALKRADAERERGVVPGLHAQPVPVAPNPVSSSRGSRMLIALLAGIALLLLGALAWLEGSREAPAQRTAPAPHADQFSGDRTPRPTTDGGQTQEASAATSAVATLAAQPAPVALPPIPQVPASPKPRSREHIAQAGAGTAAAPGRDATAIVSPAVPATALKPGTAQAADSSGQEGRIYAREELPDAVRNQLPRMSIGGSIYSTDRASRFLIINGRVFHEGDSVTPDLTLEEIKLKQAVLKYKQYRYTVSY